MVFDLLGTILAQNPILASISVIAISFFLVIRSSDYITLSIASYARKIGVSDYLIGFLIVGIGTSLPEFISSLMGNQLGEPTIVFGTLLGSSVTTTTIVLGVLAICAGKVKLQDRLLTKTRYLIFPLCILPLILAYDGIISRVDGLILIGAFIAFVMIVWRQEGTFGEMKSDVRLRHLYKDGIIFLIALMALLLSARFLVFSSIVFSHRIGIPTYLMALTVIAVGTSVGDLALDLKSIFSGHRNVAVGDIFGGLVFENTLIFGLIALINPIQADFKQLIPAAFFFLMPLAGVMILIRRGEMTRKHGVWLTGCYITFLIVQVFVVR